MIAWPHRSSARARRSALAASAAATSAMALARRTSAKKSTSLSASSFAVVSPGASLASSDMSQTMRSFDIDARPSTNRVARASAAMGVSKCGGGAMSR